ncbi:bifunctional diguanylate cyclase/phosphodiesterase [Sulfurospirillum oryzae]|uniref:bifunctional diguanylate cyclase/phosphodiesterase n=1 Tax=Sulfurospirillum oryzae TaxID=2976535 RepID=UPI0021E748DE|nr:LapD/MoxY N-terminal periplasmic domain-containing protein [Sulfurospirillum oryzae]
MTLFKQIIIVLSIFQTFIFGAVMWFNFMSSNEYVTEQAYTDALHTANSLGLSISSVASFDDVSTAETMINSVFDSGYYSLIMLEDINKEILVKKEQEVVVLDVPAWFIRYVKVQVPIATSEIMLGWTPYGVLSVQLNSGHAYRQLWIIFKDVLAIFVVVSIIGFFCLQMILRIILRPLVRVREQAEAILKSDFIFQHNIPFTKELKNVVSAMNSMVKKVKEIFDKEAEAVRRYHELLYQDTVTKMYNRRYFNIKLHEYLTSEATNAQGALILISLNDFEGLKSNIGYEKSEAFIKEMAGCITKATENQKEYVSAKLNDTDFAILAPSSSPEAFEALCQEINSLVKDLTKRYELNEKEHFINIGYAKYYAQSDSKEIFSKADFALASSKAKGAFNINHFIDEANDEVHLLLGKEAWTHELKSAMEQKRFKLAYQNVVSCDAPSETFHSELFLRLEDYNGHLHNAGYFMPMVMELKLGAQLDHYVVQQAQEILSQKIFTCKALCINLGKEIFMQSNDWDWLEESLEGFKNMGVKELYFEMPNLIDMPTHLLTKFSKDLHRYGYGFGIDNFTITMDSLELIQQINPDYIKIQASYMLDLFGENLLDAPNRSLGIITDSMEIKVIVTNVENNEQKEKLTKMGIKYIQGSLIAEPKLIG